MPFFKFKDDMNIILEYSISDFDLNVNTVIHVENCAFQNAINIKKCDIWKKDATVAVFANPPSSTEIQYVKSNYGAELTNIKNNNISVDINGLTYYSL